MHARLSWKLLLVLPLLAGCTTFDMNLMDFGRSSDEEALQVAEIVCLWEAAEGIGLDGLPTRGFAGQVLFFPRGQPEPVSIDGDVMIYVFDDQGSEDEQARPLHQFEFPAAAWNSFLYKTNLGPAYQLFVPYTRKGGNLASCALRVRMTAKDRLPVYSKIAKVTLPGRSVNPESHPADLQPAAAAEPEASIAELAAIQKASAELGAPNRTSQLQRLQQASRNAVQTADYTADSASPLEGATSADYESDAPVSRRYRMSPREHQ